MRLSWRGASDDERIRESLYEGSFDGGGQGMRIRDAEDLPKPMVHNRGPALLWQVMKYYAHYGHKDFILCLGHRADAMKNYFLNYNEFERLRLGGPKISSY